MNKQFIKWKEILPIYKGYENNKIIIKLEEHDFIDEDRLEVNE